LNGPVRNIANLKVTGYSILCERQRAG